MSMKKKVTDFIRLEEGKIGKHAATVTGALLASTVLGAVLTQPVLAAPCCHEEYIDDHGNHTNHTNSHTNYHVNDYPQPCSSCRHVND